MLAALFLGARSLATTGCGSWFLKSREFDHLGGPRGRGSSRRMVSSHWQWGQQKGSMAGGWGGASGDWPRWFLTAVRVLVAALAASP